MFTKQIPLPVKFICGFIYSQENIYLKTKAILEKRFGKIDFESQPIDFTFTNYYQPEMGQSLTRRFVSFKKLQKCEKFVDIKLFCLKIEKKYAPRGKRIVNIDPGYLNEAKLVLTTTKDFAHRIYLSKTIYAEVTLRFEKGAFCELETTFPDYRTDTYKEIFHSIRNIYHAQIKSRITG